VLYIDRSVCACPAGVEVGNQRFGDLRTGSSDDVSDDSSWPRPGRDHGAGNIPHFLCLHKIRMQTT